MTITRTVATHLLKRDPSRTATIRRQFAADLARRFRRLGRKVSDLIGEEDALGLAANVILNQRWAFRSSPDKIKAFQKWLKQQVALELFDDLEADAEDAYWRAYVEDGFRRGTGRAFDDMHRQQRAMLHEGEEQLGWHRGTREEFLRSTFGRPESVEKVKLLAGRVYTDLKGVTDDMSVRMSRVLTDGLAQGKNPREVARYLNREVGDLGKARALRVARTEIIRAHAEGQLDSLEQLGVEEVGVAVEWSTSGVGITAAGNPSPCELCAPLKGTVFKLSEAHGLLPRHPNCMCAFLPANVGEDYRGQKRSQYAIRQAVAQSLSREGGKHKSGWAGADLRIGKRRPKELELI